MNKCIFGGNFVRKPELKNVGSKNTAVVNFSLAMNQKFVKDGETQNQATFLDFEAWDKRAETIEKYFDKGDYIIVYASAKNESWEDKESGQKRSRVKFRVDDFEFVPGRKKNAEESTDTPKDSKSEEAGESEIPF